jgi:hypothetical protein
VFLKRFFILFIFVLSASTVLAQTDTPAPTSTPVSIFPLTPGSSIEGNLNNNIPAARYSFVANRGDSVTISMESTSGDLDPFLVLRDPNGLTIAQNDDAQSGQRNALITATLDQTGTYTIEATRFDGAEGTTNGTYRLSLVIAGTPTQEAPTDPLTVPPNFGVNFSILEYEEYGGGLLNENVSRRYFAFGGDQGDLVRIIITRLNGDLVPQLNVLNSSLAAVPGERQARDTEFIAYVTLPQRGWYLIEASARSGSGNFDLYIDRLSGAILRVGEPVVGEFTPETPSISYIFNARIGDFITANMFTTEQNSGVQPELRLLNLSLQTIDSAQGTRFATLQAAIPRSGPYIIQATNLRPETTGGFNLRLTSRPVNIAQLPITPINFNESVKGVVNSQAPIVYYRFTGKIGSLVTVRMTATDGDLDPFLILTDSDLNELAFNDNASGSRNARIAQFALPKDGDYIILATRTGLANGTSSGSFDLALTVGQFTPQPGAVTATVRWTGEADLNLFVRDPSGQTVSWSNPSVPSGGRLEIDSNTNCETPSDQPVEHVFWPGSAPTLGDYEVWVWYQNTCGRNVPIDFRLNLAVGGKIVLEVNTTLQPGQRFDSSMRVLDDGESFPINRGRIVTPSPQQNASEGGDTLIFYGDAITDTLTNQVYARFYQFEGQAGDQVTIRAEAVTGNLDPILVLRDVNNQNLATNDDENPETKNSLLTYTLPANGNYVIAVTRFGVQDGITTGDYQLTLTRSP